MKATVVRLKNAPAGQPYAIERVEDLTENEAAKQAAAWWESKGTLAVVVSVGEAEDSRYEREYLDGSRVPDGWVKAKPKAVPPMPTAPTAPLPPPRVAPSLFNDKRKPSARVECGQCGRNVRQATVAEAPHDPTDPTRCPGCGVGFACEVCGTPLPEGRKYPGDDDPTPSGRLAGRRCPGCGRRLAATARQIWKMYTGR